MADAYAVPAFGTTGLAGWDQYASLNQDERSAMTQRGHPDTTALLHLSRALYIPRHDSGTTYMAIHDISTQYKAATHSLPIGSSRYMVALGLMAKPSGDGMDGMPVLYDVDFNRQEDGGAVVPSVRCREHSPQTEVELAISTTEDMAGTITTRDANPIEIPLSITYPIPPSATRDGTFKHPYFAFQIPDPSAGAGSVTFEWQIHPSLRGRLRYTLVRQSATQQQQQQQQRWESDAADIQAVYYHIGVGASLSLPYSEGILLLPDGRGSARDSSIVVTSALGMLWRLRELYGGKVKSSKTGKTSGRKTRLGSVKGLFGRRE